MIKVAKARFSGSDREYTYLVPDRMSNLKQGEQAIVETPSRFSRVLITSFSEARSLEEINVPESVLPRLKCLLVSVLELTEVVGIWLKDEGESKKHCEQYFLNLFGENFEEILRDLEVFDDVR